MMHVATSFAAGLVFGAGLIVSGMSDPGKVIGFLDLAGNWDPSLGFVMGGAILVGFFAFRFARKRTQSFFGGTMRLPASRDIDQRLVLGGIVFGVGWGSPDTARDPLWYRSDPGRARAPGSCLPCWSACCCTRPRTG